MESINTFDRDNRKIVDVVCENAINRSSKQKVDGHDKSFRALATAISLIKRKNIEDPLKQAKLIDRVLRNIK